MKRVWVPIAGATRVSATLAEAKGPSRASLVLGHGAGGDRTQDSLVRLQEALTPLGVRSLAFNFPYAEAKRKAPDRMPKLEEAYSAALEQARALLGRGEPLLAGGRSMGGRVATHLAAAGAPIAGLVLLGYPLHAAGDPEKLRVEHLPRIECPLLFISGTNDALAPLALLARHVKKLGKRATLHSIEGADHGLDLPRRAGRDRGDVASECASVIEAWLDSQPGLARRPVGVVKSKGR